MLRKERNAHGEKVRHMRWRDEQRGFKDSHGTRAARTPSPLPSFPLPRLLVLHSW